MKWIRVSALVAVAISLSSYAAVGTMPPWYGLASDAIAAALVAVSIALFG